MSVEMANVSRPMAPKQTQQKPPENSKVYDPVKTAEGMFNGCVSRIALALRDPKNYGEYTPYIIAESSKLFQDALDDLSLQVLDVKWLLEQKLASNRARREAERKAKESAAAPSTTPGKRKHNEVEESPETPTKRPKTANQSPKSTEPAQNGELRVGSTQAERKPTPQSETITIDDPEPEKPVPAEPAKQTKPDAEPAQQPDQNFDADDFARPSTQGTPAITEDGMDMFHSMFDSTDQNNDTSSVNGGDGGMNFEFDNAFIQDPTQPDTAVSNTNNSSNTLSQARPESQDQSRNQTSSLGSMLHGLEQYANMPNQPDDMNPGLVISQNMNTNTMGNDNPFLYGSGRNEFDDLLADDSMAMGDMGGDFGDVNVDIQENLDFDELFGID